MSPLAQEPEELLALDEALTRLAVADPQAAELVKLRYFAGLTVKQAAEALGVAATDRRLPLGLRRKPGSAQGNARRQSAIAPR